MSAILRARTSQDTEIHSLINGHRMVCCSLSLTRHAYIAAGVAPPCTATTLAEKRLTALVGEITWGGPAAGC
jgi:hypothetical protein